MSISGRVLNDNEKELLMWLFDPSPQSLKSGRTKILIDIFISLAIKYPGVFIKPIDHRVGNVEVESLVRRCVAKLQELGYSVTSDKSCFTVF